MSVGPLGGIAGSAAGSPLAQTQGAEPERSAQDAATQRRRIESDQKAESAAGIGEADGEDHETAERDADGRRLWETPPAGNKDQQTQEDTTSPGLVKDTTGQRGNLLDLSG